MNLARARSAQSGWTLDLACLHLPRVSKQAGQRENEREPGSSVGDLQMLPKLRPSVDDLFKLFNVRQDRRGSQGTLRLVIQLSVASPLF